MSLDAAPSTEQSQAIDSSTLRALLESLGDATLVVDLSGQIVFANRRAGEMFAVDASALIGGDGIGLFADRRSGGYARYLRELLLRPSVYGIPAHLDLMGHRRDGVLFPIEVSRGFFDAPELSGVTLIVRDVSDRNAREKQLRDGLGRDRLTGVSSRGSFEDLGGIEVFRAGRYGRPLSALMIDIDHFKAVNDRFGHPVGDAVLRSVAAVMQSALRRCDLLARWGGEEFAALLPETDSRGAMLAAERLRGLVASQTQRTQAGDIATSISVGVAEIGPDTADLAQLIATADRALYRAKAGGRNCVVIAESEPRTP